ncbi:MAG: nitrilase-related carbon-nitrogen hydrolase [Anaerolineales bacterium]|nr:nitrilase-related carbon-nitrogen hydrolase [Anaerolineales bacterium]
MRKNLLDRNYGQRILVGMGLSTLGGMLFAFAFPPFDLWPLIFIGLVPVILSQHRVMPEKFSGAAYGIGVGVYFALYFAGTFNGGPLIMRWLPLLIGLIAGLASSRDRAFHQRTGCRWFLLQGPLVWVGIELIRGLIPTVGTWGFAAYALHGQPWLIQPVSVVGVYGLSFLILVINYGLAFLVIRRYDRWLEAGGCSPPSMKGKPERQVGWAGAALGIWMLVSLIMFQFPVPDPAFTIRAAAVQTGFRIQSEQGLEKLLELTDQAVDQGAELVVWPEGILPFDPRDKHTRVLKAYAAEREVHLVIGYVVKTTTGSRNEAVILTPDGELFGPYGKDHPVGWSGETSLSRGPHRAYSTELGRLGMIICYDLDFTNSSRAVARDGARLIAVPSFDWGNKADKHYTHLVFRAVENRTAMVKADIGFDSALIDPRGRVLKKEVNREAKSGVLVADLPAGPEQTPIRHLGDWFGWLCLGGMVIFILYDGKDLLFWKN